MDRPVDLTWDEAQHALFPLMRTDNRTNIVPILREYAWLAVALGAGTAAHRAWSLGSLALAAYLPMAALAIVLVAIAQHRLSGLAHEATHYTLFKNRLANELVSDLLLMFPIVAWTQTYRAVHLGHHRFVNDPLRDPDLVRLNHSEPHHFPVSKRRFWVRYVLRSLWPPSIIGYLIGRARAANLGGNDAEPLKAVYGFRVARCLRGAYWLALLTAVHALHAWPIFWIYWAVPLLTVYPLLMQLREIAHHSNAPDDGDLTNSRVFRVNPLLNYAVFPYGQAFHLTHHLFAMIPHYRIDQAHDLLQRHRPYRESVLVCRGYFFRRWGTEGPSVLDILASRNGHTDVPRDSAPNAKTGRPRLRKDEAHAETTPEVRHAPHLHESC